jgi:hypothetical protein
MTYPWSDWAGWSVPLALVGQFAVMLGLGISWYISLRKDKRETKSTDLTDAKMTVDLLREQADTLRKHRDERELEFKLEREEWKLREAKLEQRVSNIETRLQESERDYRNLVLTVTTMGFCTKAGTGCKDYDPGDRRINPKKG